MHFHIYCKEKAISISYKNAFDEYTKRLQPYCNISFHHSTSIQFSKDFMKTNHSFIFIKTQPSTYSSENFAKELNNLQLHGNSIIHVIIGYSEQEFYETIQSTHPNIIPNYFSITNNTLSPKTQSLLFYEQLYRAYTILQGKTYHK